MKPSSNGFQPPDILDLPPEEAVARVIDYSAKLPASDLFFATNANHVAVSVRHLGIIRGLMYMPSELGKRCMSHIKVMAGMDVSERRRPLDGRWIRQQEDGNLVDLRINTIPTLYGEDFALRFLIRQSQLRGLEQLGLLRQELNELLAMLTNPSGLVLVTGPTGSGKTTTLYACLQHLSNEDRKINTIEDPIEYELGGIRQSQVNTKIEVGFAELLRSVLRQAPDVIMVGEIRDPESAATAVYAANSGHLVLATLHSPIAAGAIQRMLSLGVHPHFLSHCLIGVVAQRLIRTLCPLCKTAFHLTYAPNTFDEVKRWLEPGQGDVIYGAQGCSECHGTGYAGRVGVFETMKVSKEIRRLIAEEKTIREIRQKAVDEGLIELRQSALLKVARGDTNAEEVIRAIQSEHLGLDE